MSAATRRSLGSGVLGRSPAASDSDERGRATGNAPMRGWPAWPAWLVLATLAACTTEDRTVNESMDPTVTPSAAESMDASMDASAESATESSTVLVPVPSDATISFSLSFDVGSQNDPPGKEGLAYLTGQMLADASTENRRYEEILEALYPIASSYDVRVDREMTTLTGRTHRDNLDLFFELYSDAYLRPAFDADDFQRIRNDAVNYLENALRFSSDEELGKAALYEFVYSGTSYAHPTVGTVEGLQSITLDDVRGFYEGHFSRANATPGLAGGFDDALTQRFDGSLANLPGGSDAGADAGTDAAEASDEASGDGSGEAPSDGSDSDAVADAAAPPGTASAAIMINTPEIEGREVLLVSKPGADASISFGFPIDVSRGERDFYALWVANSWLGEHRNQSSHLFEVIREVRGLNYGDYSYIEAYPEGGRRTKPPVNVARHKQIFEVWIRTLPNHQALFALRAAIRELENLVDNGLTEEEFELTRSFLNKYILHFAVTTSQRLGYAMDDRFYGIGGEGHLARFREVLGELTLEEVNAAIREHLQYENLKIAIVTGDAEGLREALAADAPSPIEYAQEMPEEVLAEDEEISTLPLGITEDRIYTVPVESIFQGE